MKQTKICDLLPSETEVTVQAWVETIRDQKAMQFVVLRDSTGKVQLTIEKLSHPQIATQIEQLFIGSVISVTAKVVLAPTVKLGKIELIPSALTVLSAAKASPLTPDSGLELRQDYRWIELRDPKKAFFFKLQTVTEMAMREWAFMHSFKEIHTPHITAFSSEGGSEVFEIKNYFGQKAYLTQSSQLYKQCAMASGLERTFEIGPCFRANPSFTSRHDTEFIQVDMELSFVTSHHDVMDTEEEWVKYFTKKIETELGEEIKQLFGLEFKAQSVTIPRVTLIEAYELIEKEKGYKVPKASKGDLDPEGEKLICEIAKQKFGSDFVFVTDFPAAARAFYTMKREDNPLLTKSFDLLYKGVEVTSGAQREHRPEQLKAQIAEKGIDPANMQFYTQFFEYGCPPHGGYGFGITRFMMRALEVASVKEVTFLYRGPSRLAP